MNVTLETLELTPEQLKASKEAVQKMAYFNWLDAGRHDARPLEHWLKAQREWIERYYVPNRMLDGERPESDDQPATIAAAGRNREPSPRKSRGHIRAELAVE